MNPSLCYLPFDCLQRNQFKREIKSSTWKSLQASMWWVWAFVGQTLVGVFAAKVVYFFT